MRRKNTDEERTVKGVTQQERLIDIAHELWYKDKYNPTRESVIQALKDEGIHIRDKDPSKTFKLCKLEFLKTTKCRGRPPKNAALVESAVAKQDQATYFPDTFPEDESTASPVELGDIPFCPPCQG